MTDLSSTYGSDYNAGYRYSGYENTGNIDLNYILVDGYPTWIYPLGIIGALGNAVNTTCGRILGITAIPIPISE